MEEAINYAAKQAKLGKDWELQEYPKVRSLEQRILQKLTSDNSARTGQLPVPLKAEFLKLQTDLSILQSMNDPRGIYARLPFNWRLD
jgi:protease-4